jgi:hypothetical protein
MKIMEKHLHIYYVWNLKFEIIRFSKHEVLIVTRLICDLILTSTQQQVPLALYCLQHKMSDIDHKAGVQDECTSNSSTL